MGEGDEKRFRHIQKDLFFGYRALTLVDGQSALVARPEKALIDLINLEPGGDSPEDLRELRLQHLEELNQQVLDEMAARIGKPKLERAADFVVALIEEETTEC